MWIVEIHGIKELHQLETEIQGLGLWRTTNTMKQTGRGALLARGDQRILVRKQETQNEPSNHLLPH